MSSCDDMVQLCDTCNGTFARNAHIQSIINCSGIFDIIRNWNVFTLVCRWLDYGEFSRSMRIWYRYTIVWKQILLFGGSFLEECMPYWHRFVKLNKILFEIVIRIFISPNVGRWRENCWDFSHRMRNVCGYDILAPMKHKKTLRSCGCHRIEWDTQYTLC